MNPATADTEDEDLREFYNEALDLLDEAEACLLQIEKKAPLKDRFDAIFRSFHSIKGGAGMLGISDLQDHTHTLETFFSQFRDKDSISAKDVTYLLEGIDKTRSLITGTDTGGSAAPAHEEVEADTDTTASVDIQVQTGPDESLNLNADESMVYIVDDEPLVAEMMEDVVAQTGFQTKVFHKAADLISELASQKPDLVISDMAMPEMNGLEMLKKINSIDPNLPVIFVSGYLNKDILIESIKHGVYATIEKPIDEEVLVSYCFNAITKYKILNMFVRSLNLIMYQFADLDDFLKKEGREQERNRIYQEMQDLWKNYKAFKHFQKSPKG